MRQRLSSIAGPLHGRRSLPPSRALSPFVGRDAELADIDRVLADPNCRLLTLVGPGGIGKTRLALEAAHRSADAFPDGIFLVELQPVMSSAYVLTTLASAVDLQVGPGQDVQRKITEHLADKTTLLLLDNFERLLDSAPLVGELLAQCPHTHVLVTSREELNLLEECVYDVAGLPVPLSESEEAVEYSAAARLFVQSGRRAQHGFALTADNARDIYQICRAVDGMPLALELAAAWLRGLSCKEVADSVAVDLAGLLAMRATSLNDIAAFAGSSTRHGRGCPNKSAGYSCDSRYSMAISRWKLHKRSLGPTFA